MLRKTFTLLGLGAMCAGPAFAQTPSPQPGGNLTIQYQEAQLTPVARTTAAVNYRPRGGDTTIAFAGTALLPGAKGEAEISGEKGYMRIDARFDKLQPPARFGREYLTYVLWAVTPEGRAKNLGEVQYDDDDARVKVTTDFQSFGLIVTAEPYFAVTRPSDVVVMENIVRKDTKGNVEPIEAHYQALRRGAYLMNRDANDLEVKALEPGAPLDLAEARNAIELARLAGADRYATEPFAKATNLLSDAEVAREKHRNKNEIMMAARQAVQTAEDARTMAVQKREAEYQALQRAASAAREQAALTQARDAADRARVAEAERNAAEREARAEEAQRRQAQANADARDAARLQAEQQARDEQARRVQAEADARVAQATSASAEQQARQEQARREQAEAEARAAAASSASAERDRSAAQAERDAAERQRLAAETARRDAQATLTQVQRDQEALRRSLQEQLNVVLETRETARGLIVDISDVLFDTASANLKPGAREKLAKVAGIIASHPGLNLTVEGHTDNVGNADYNQRLSEDRAMAVHDYLVRQGIAPGVVGTAGFGESKPVASNGTSAGRQQNRRVEVVVTGAPIGK
jgi:outer membrane protein OmpA-like peptidoglycan-associated protein